MILRILGADFSSANIGTLSTYVISKSIGAGISHNIPNFVDKNSSITWTLTVEEGYLLGSYSIIMNGETITPVINENTMTITIPNVTGNVRIVVATVNENTGEEDIPVVPPVEPDEPDTGDSGSTGNGDWYGNLYTGKSDAHNTFINYNDIDSLENFTTKKNLWYGITDAKGMGILSEKTIKKICLYEVPEGVTLKFYISENYTSSTNVSTGTLVHTIVGDVSSSTTIKEYPVNIQIPAGATLTWNGEGTGLKTIPVDIISMSYPVKYGTNGPLNMAISFSGMDFYLE